LISSQTKVPPISSTEERHFFRELLASRSLPESDLAGLYSVTAAQIIENGGLALLRKYGMSPSKALRAVFPEHEWDSNHFNKRPQGHWHDLAQQRKSWNEIGVLNNVYDSSRWRESSDNSPVRPSPTELERWYQVQPKTLQGQHVKTLLQLHGGSFRRALIAAFPDHPWKSDLFKHTRNPRTTTRAAAAALKASNDSLPPGDNNTEVWLPRFQERLGIATLEDWYRVQKRHVVEARDLPEARRYLRSHGDSVSKMVMSLFPSHDWQPWRFPHAPRSWWQSNENQLRFLEWAASQLGIQGMEGWYQVSIQQLSSVGGAGLLHHYNRSMFRMLKSAFPGHVWQRYHFEQAPKSGIATPDAS
jgi:hypothetical protein